MNAVSQRSTSATFVEDYAAAARRLAEAIGHTDLRLPVTACPGWTAYDVVVHLGNVHSWAATIVETGRSTPEAEDRPRSSRPRQVAEWYAGKAEDLLLVLREAVPDRPCWNFVRGTGPNRFWQRRQLHETLVHLHDLDRAAGRLTAVDPAVAADGVDEVLEVMLPRVHAKGHATALERPLLLTATDTGDSWQLRPGDGPPEVSRPGRPRGGAHTREDGRTDHAEDALEASAAGLYRLLWHRAGTDDVGARVSGCADRVETFLRSPLVP